jgi:hypothetical protein
MTGSRLPEPSEGEDPRCATCRDVGAAYCDDCSSRVRPDARSGSRLPKPLAAAGEGEDRSSVWANFSGDWKNGVPLDWDGKPLPGYEAGSRLPEPEDQR